MVERDIRDGVHHNPEPETHPEWFTTAYFHRPAEVRAEMTFVLVESIEEVFPAAFQNWVGTPAPPLLDMIYN